MKNIRIVHGTLMYPLEVGSRALIFEEGRYLHTSTVIAIHGVTPQQILVERHSTVVVLCLFTLSKEQEVEKCMC